jgi:hypothetical protein
MSRLLDREKALDTPNREGELRPLSAWRNPLPLGDYTTSPVIVYFYSDRWIPMTCFSLAEAITLYRKALSLGKEILVYPPALDPFTERVAKIPQH